MAVVLIPIALILPLKGIEKVMLIGSVLLVLVVELLNTAVESVVTEYLKKPIIFPKEQKMPEAQRFYQPCDLGNHMVHPLLQHLF